MVNYQDKIQLKAKMRQAGLTIRELANHLKIPPGTLGNQLSGWSPLSKENEEKLLKFISETALNENVHKIGVD